MTIHYVWYGDIKEDKFEVWIKWWRDEEKVRKFKDALTEDMTLKGVYVAINGTASYDYEIWYELENWEVLDRDRDNQKLVAIQKEFVEKNGMTDKWARTRAFRSVQDVKSPIFDI